ncbi:hypothetical protein F5Y09DRAFT_351532, partial [Xylaria sp. FL1042]
LVPRSRFHFLRPFLLPQLLSILLAAIQFLDYALEVDVLGFLVGIGVFLSGSCEGCSILYSMDQRFYVARAPALPGVAEVFDSGFDLFILFLDAFNEFFLFSDPFSAVLVRHCALCYCYA